MNSFLFFLHLTFQDCNHQETANVIRSYGDRIVFIQQPDQSEPLVPKNEKKFKGYFKIARHYGWALNQTFVHKFQHEQVTVSRNLNLAGPKSNKVYRFIAPACME